MSRSFGTVSLDFEKAWRLREVDRERVVLEWERERGVADRWEEVSGSDG